MKKILALANAVTDVIRNVSEEHIRKLGFEKGRFYVATPEQAKKLSAEIDSCAKIPGGSAANVIAGAALLGAKTGIIGTIGNDAVGKIYKDDLKKRGVELHISEKSGRSGMCHTFITPDGERTFALDYGVTMDFEVPEKAFENAEFFHTTGYEFDGRPDVVKKAVKLAKSRGIKFTIDIADLNVIKKCNAELKELIKQAEIVFADEYEAGALTGKQKPEEALDELSKISKIAVVKLGKNGSLIKQGKNIYKIPAVKVDKLENTNGAGDAYAAAFLTALAGGKTLEEAGMQGSEFAAKVCKCKGARVE